MHLGKLVAIVLVALGPACTPGPESGVGSESNFQECTTDADCNGGACINNVCDPGAVPASTSSQGGSGGAAQDGSAGMPGGTGSGLTTDGLPPSALGPDVLEGIGSLADAALSAPVTLEWIALPGGEYQMGSPDGSDGPDNLPRHTVNVPAFEITKTEITVAMYDACIDAGMCRSHYSRTDDARCAWTGGPVEDRPNHPMTCLSWQRAREFCESEGGRLPTEAEFEYAARSGGQDKVYAWGNAPPACTLASSNPAGCALAFGDPVCAHPDGRTAQGLCDMAGNAWEWVEDVWVSGYTDAPIDGSARTTGGGTDRVQRGGSYEDGVLDGLRSVYRFQYSGIDEDAGYSLGFRCARAPTGLVPPAPIAGWPHD